MFSILPKALLIAAGVQVACQLYKFLSATIRLKRPAWRHLATFGGMPSAHSAFVTSLASAIGVLEGTASSLFALTVVFGGIVILDAYKLRGNVQKQAAVVNRLQKKYLEKDEQIRINEMVGHSLAEIAVGILVGLALAIPAAFVLKSLV